MTSEIFDDYNSQNSATPGRPLGIKLGKITSSDNSQFPNISINLNSSMEGIADTVRTADRHASQPIAKNFPPLPACCRCKPCYVQDIQREIPPPLQRFARLLFIVWLAHALLLLLNLVVSAVYLALPPPTNSSTRVNSPGIATFISSLLLAVLLPPAAYATWFRSVYNAFKKNSSTMYIAFFVTFSVQILIDILQTVGIESFPSCGWINGIATLSTNTTAGGIMLVLALLFTLFTALDIFLLIQVHRVYRGHKPFSCAKSANLQSGGGAIANDTSFSL